MSCGCIDDFVTDDIRYSVHSIPCEHITVDLLRTYKNPIDCYITYKLWSNVDSSKEELESASSYLESLISQKLSDPGDCSNIESLVLVKVIVSKIINKGVCL